MIGVGSFWARSVRCLQGLAASSPMVTQVLSILRCLHAALEYSQSFGMSASLWSSERLFIIAGGVEYLDSSAN